ncbi:putative Macrophage migration inhibitory factor [Aphelenchoides besseyi]|nr:putative Macrophage migration inhibitory factor [Aphelenchoides besseyi]KAI6211117.1 putative Macrophage migration inhibitory factor [Aphelenchoides besseyi]
MPILQIVTNLPKSKFTADFVKKASTKASELTERPEQVIEVVVQADQIISFAGTQEPAAYVFLGGIHCLSEERRGPIGKSLNEFLVNELGLKSERFYIHFLSIQPEDVSFTGKLFSQILAGK